MTTIPKEYFGNYQEETNAIYLYTLLSQVEPSEELRQVYAKMAASEQKHADYWKQQIEAKGGKVDGLRPDNRSRILGWIAKRFGTGVILPILIGGEQKANAGYVVEENDELSKMASEERSHERMMRQMAKKSETGGMEGGLLAQMEGRHRASGGNALRAAVLGANDGLVSNLSLVMGVAGADLSGKSILITGLAGLLAGAASMALGEWLSVQSSRELYEHQIAIEKQELMSVPEEEETELALIYQAKGLSETQARDLARQIMSNAETSVDTLAREELGIDPKELGGSAWVAAITSFFLFAVGAIIPVIAFIFMQGTQAIFLSVGLSTLGLFAIGAAITLMTGRNWIVSGLRQVIFGILAAALTFGIGKLIGVSING